MTRLLFALYLIEVGLLLAVSPWTSWWYRNYFADHVPLVAWAMTTEGLRAIVVAAGALTALIGIADLHGVVFRRVQSRRLGFDDSRDH